MPYAPHPSLPVIARYGKRKTSQRRNYDKQENFKDFTVNNAPKRKKLKDDTMESKVVGLDKRTNGVKSDCRMSAAERRKITVSSVSLDHVCNSSSDWGHSTKRRHRLRHWHGKRDVPRLNVNVNWTASTECSQRKLQPSRVVEVCDDLKVRKKVKRKKRETEKQTGFKVFEVFTLCMIWKLLKFLFSVF